ncbi:energy transducer TonB [Hydrocarboniphaga sp.]|uniref:energy transducer TonB n=1 Tax=Hydrocarboniphaga sp. TaxID=2033016 RepID=UPI003D14BF82
MISVIAAHAAAFGVLLVFAQEAAQPPEPQVMSVSFLTPAEPVKPPEPVPPAPPPPEPVLKPKPKPVIASTRTTPVADAIVAPPPVDQPDPEPAAPVQAYAEAAEPAPPGQPEPPRFDMAYLSNPQPSFPAMSKKLHEEGTVVLRVHVSAAGEALTVEVAQSSGYQRLDDAALRAVRKWKFVPSKRGDTPVDGVAMVPMVFSLKKNA